MSCIRIRCTHDNNLEMIQTLELTPQFLLVSAIYNPLKEFRIVTMNTMRYDMISQQF
jgi:hypothetical protein